MRRLASEPGFSTALETGTLTQCAVEEAWLGDQCLNAYSGCITTKMSPACLKSAASETVATPKSIINNATFVSSTIDSVGISESQHFRSFLKGESTPLSDFLDFKLPVGNTEASIDDLRHEAVVALFGTNRVRRMVPNFKLVYAYTIGKIPSKQTKARPVAPVPSSPRRRRGVIVPKRGGGAKNTPPLPSLIIEQYPGTCITLTEAIKTFLLDSPKDFYAIIMQLVYALKVASEEIEFTHYDMHAGNVELYPIPNVEKDATCYIPYMHGSVFVAAKHVAAITNCGFSHFTVPNSDKRNVAFGFAAKGRSELVSIGIFRDRPNPMTDVYRLLITSGVAALEAAKDGTGSELIGLISALIQYFNQSETLQEIIANQKETYYYLPLTPNARALSFEDFISHAKREMRTKFGDTRSLVSSAVSKKANDVVLRPGLIGRGFVLTKISEISTPTLSFFAVPDTFQRFVDDYTYFIDITSDKNAKDVSARQLTAVFIKRFSEGKSLFDLAWSLATSEIRQHTLYIGKMLEGNGLEYVPLPSDLKLIATSAIGDACYVTAVSAARILDSYISICEIVSSAKYAIDVYWKTAATIPPHVALKFSEIERLQHVFAVAVGTIARLVAEDCRLLFPEKFNTKTISAQLKAFRDSPGSEPIIRVYTALSSLATAATNKTLIGITRKLPGC